MDDKCTMYVRTIIILAEQCFDRNQIKNFIYALAYPSLCMPFLMLSFNDK